MIRIAIDGACKGNGTENCVSGSGVFIQRMAGDDMVGITFTKVEENSTNQRGELNALLIALNYCASLSGEEAQIITDSEYLFNTITKEWYKGWERRGWLTKDATPVKNQDLWKPIIAAYESCDPAPMLYHIKGHILPDGGDAAMRLLAKDSMDSYNYYCNKFDEYEPKKLDQIKKAQALSETNNGFALDRDILKTFVAMNSVADRIAVQAIVDKN